MATKGSHVFKTAGLNTLAFGIIIAVQQILIFPSLGRLVDVSNFSHAVLFVTLSMIVVNVVGGEVSNVALLRGQRYSERKLPWDAPRLAFVSLLVCFAGLAILSVMQVLDWRLGVEYLLVIALGIVRTIGLAPDKFRGRFGGAVAVSCAYAVGAIVGLLLVQFSESAVIPFIIAEILSVLTLMVLRFRSPAIRLTIKRTDEYANTRNRFYYLALVAVIMNAVSYLDRILIIPLLGAAALAVYYASSALSKSLSMVSNPVANAFLARLGSVDDTSRNTLFKKSVLMSAPLFIVSVCISYGISYVGVLLLYPQFFELALEILVPISLASALGVVSDLFRPLVMRFAAPRVLLGFYVAYAAAYLALVFVMANTWGLQGFAWSVACAKGLLLAMFLVQAVVYQRPLRSSGTQQVGADREAERRFGSWGAASGRAGK